MKNKIKITSDVINTDGDLVIPSGTVIEKNSTSGAFEYKKEGGEVFKIDTTVLSAIDQGLIDAFRYEYIKEEI